MGDGSCGCDGSIGKVEAVTRWNETSVIGSAILNLAEDASVVIVTVFASYFSVGVPK